ncbi:HD domain-containing phosphohydrolase [Methylomarinum vadi]|uniref:HD domain-containing phosphohydrolase n=1 Tax=Methylomarinum vadi TaxID=438855 RepID=UPI0004DECC68|nr:HD domain-containing phosphohydrolase [Methylomarinum vadi]
MPKQAEKKFRFSIRVTVVSVFILATLFTVAVAISLQYHFSRKMAIDAALSRHQLTAAGTGQYLLSIDDKAVQTTQVLAKFPGLVAGGWIDPNARNVFAEVMRSTPIYYALYIGFANGDFYELVNLETNPLIRTELRAAEEDRWVAITVRGTGKQRRRRFDYLDDAFNLRISRQEPSDFDASKRPWFINANARQVYKTPPYLFQQLQTPGQTYSIAIPSADAVLAVDITLSSLSAYLKQQPLSGDGEIYLYRQNGEMIASNLDDGEIEDEVPEAEPFLLNERQQATLKKLGKLRVSNEMNWPPIDYAVSGEPKGYAVDLIRLLAEMTGLSVEFVNGYPWPELVEMFRNGDLDILQPVFRTPDNESLGMMSRPFLRLPYAIVTRSNEAEIHRFEQLAGKTLAIPQGWSIIDALHEHFPAIQIKEVESPRQALLDVVSGQAYATLDSAAILRYTAKQFFIDDLSFHENLDMAELQLPDELHFVLHPEQSELLAILNSALQALSPPVRQALFDKWFGDKELATQQTMSTVPYPQLLNWQEQGRLNQLTSSVINGRDYFIFITSLSAIAGEKEYFAAVIPAENILAESLDKVKMSLLITSAALLLLLPVSWLFASPIVRPIKRLAIENEKIKNRKYDDVVLTDSVIIEIHELVISIKEMALAIKQHEHELKELMESIIRLIAQAIDDKSPYTAGHCARVPELALMIAKAAEQADNGPFQGFRFHSADELREYRIAAWLHDCGKITTPEHVVDKATKLETIYNRIHEIRMRFEVLWRDAEIEYLRQSINAPEQSKRLYAELEQNRSQLRDDFEFIARTNIGGESLAEADLARLHALSKLTWQRHFDDRAGLSTTELERFKSEPPPLPATETLLSDKPEHIIERLRDTDFPAEYGIRMDIPERLYNLGELYNLSVSRGTLTAEDRFKINEHMISTIKMLESVPFPKELARVPKYASTHHETLIGTGYPRKLTAEQLSIPERILAVADIFEALTAADRPYKEPKPVSEAIEILYRMVQEQHVDRDVFELFLRSGVYLDYGRRFLKPQQLDAVDIDRYLDNSNV